MAVRLLDPNGGLSRMMSCCGFFMKIFTTQPYPIFKVPQSLLWMETPTRFGSFLATKPAVLKLPEYGTSDKINHYYIFFWIIFMLPRPRFSFLRLSCLQENSQWNDENRRKKGVSSIPDLLMDKHPRSFLSSAYRVAKKGSHRSPPCRHCECGTDAPPFDGHLPY